MSIESQTASDSSVGQADPLASELAPEQAAPAPADDAIAPVWLQRLSLFVLVLFCVYLGALVAFLPWWTRVWDHNLLIQSYPRVAALMHLGAVRGFVSGLGLLDIWIGVSEAIHYRDHRPRRSSPGAGH